MAGFRLPHGTRQAGNFEKSPTAGGCCGAKFVGSDSKDGNCPSVYETDRGTEAFQGKKVVDGDRAWYDVRFLDPDETLVEIPRELWKHIPKE
ncbi:hypothetical protein ABH940_001635 [Streptacidiphilus sp. BW17]